MNTADVIIFIILLFIFFFLGTVLAPDPPRLVGYGCEGASGPLYADEEDHFPVCAAIVRND